MTRQMIRFVRSLFGVAVVALSNCAASATDGMEEQVDKLFAEWTRSDRPGCAIAATRNGHILLERGYGMADLEQGVAIRPHTVFNVASVSKQFTAAAIVLLAQEGHLSLDDDVREYVPELRDYGSPITIRHLANHTSGLRDHASLLGLSGWNWVDAVPKQQALDLIARQKSLNFEPGEEYSYSNAGYFLMSVIVERVSGMRFSVFAEQRIFEPLGMLHSKIYDDRRMIMKNRAVGHVRLTDGGVGAWRPTYEIVGDGALLTSVQDMALWERNFLTPSLGRDPQGLIETLTTRGRLNDGSTTEYGFGLGIDEYRGLSTVEHSGNIPGYAIQLLRFPKQRFSVQVMCNQGRLPAGPLARSVADVYLEDEFKTPPLDAVADQGKDDEDHPEAVELPPERLSVYAGRFYSEELDVVYKITVDDKRLSAQVGYLPPVLLVPEAEDAFMSENGFGLRFSRALEGHVTGFVLDAPRVHGIRFSPGNGAPCP